MRKISMTILKIFYGLYNAAAISIVVLLFVSQKGWAVKGNNREYKRI